MTARIGILGGFGPDATLDLEREILRVAREHLPATYNRGYPPMVTVHVRHSHQMLTAEGEAEMPPRPHPDLLEAAAWLGTRSDLVVIAANAPHLFEDEIGAASGAEIVSMVSVVDDELSKRAVGPPGVLAFGEDRVYRARLAERGPWLTSTPECQRPLDAAIRSVLEHGEDRGGAGEPAREAVDELRRAGARAIVLGCTEIPILLDDESRAPDLIDPARLVARRVVERAV